MKSHLVRWHKEYSDKGLVIMDFELDPLDRLKKAAKKGNLPYFIAHDSGHKASKAFGIKAYAAAALVGVDGKVIWNGFPANKVQKCEEMITKELEKVSEETLKKIAKKPEAKETKEEKDEDK
ncbi:MAG: redoxin domain-containing protein [Planctomycetes bacterium]|nr:redoxin domain-containing protein [Planctomycetota bacterium]